MSLSSAKLHNTSASPLGRYGAAADNEQLPLLSHASATPSSSSARNAIATRGDSTLIDIANQHERNVEADPRISHEFWEMLSLVYPVVVTSALEFLPGLTCTILAGHLDSSYNKEYFANISAYSIGFGLSSALDTLCSQAYGAKRYDKIGIYFQSGLIVIGVCLLPIFLLNWYSEGFLLYLGQEPHVARLAQDFSRYSLPGVPFVFLYELFRKELQAQNIMQPLVVIALIGNIVTIVAGYVLAYHTGLGFDGIAIARTLGNIVLPLLLIPYFKLYPHHLTQWWCDGWSLKEAWFHVGLFLHLGIPGMLQMVMEWWAFEIISLMAGVLPNSLIAMSAHAVLLNVTTVLYMVFVGFSVAANIRVGNCLGANEPKKAQMVARLAMMIAVSISVFIAFALFTLPRCRQAGRRRDLERRRLHLGIEGLWIDLGLGVIISASTLVVLFSRWKWDELTEDAQARTAK
uniref:Polysaccharide biosynthesis protein C-terminal domain-containing protein n=1 Tax=Globisporangium ultimum (strain ATCC 200006 / CBS 805.95 / DAOM BR144) TaxID=431595 RepID=K3WXD8_GLOUD